jgi:hypothetical protein
MPENSRRVAAEDQIALVGGDRQRLHPCDAVEIAHVERIVAAKEHLAGTDRGDEKFERRLGVEDGVVEEFAERSLRRLPLRPGKPDLFAITCDVEGSLAIYDSDARRVVRYVGLDPDTGQPILGFSPFGLAVEPIDPGRATPYNPLLTYDPTPCAAGRECHRIYVGSFIDNWINVLEMDPDQPTEVALVKRIGTGP